MTDKFRVAKASKLMAFLNYRLKGWSKNNIKQRLQTGCVVVNGAATTQHDLQLDIDDTVEVLPKGSGKLISRGAKQLKVLYSDDDIVVINKPAGLLSVASAGENKKTALEMLRQQLSTKRNKVKLWPAHRLDRETSGVLLFATSRQVRERITAAWAKSQKTYLAVVEGVPRRKEGTIDQPLRSDENGFRTHVGEHPDAKHAVTHYRVARSSVNRALLEVKIETGRQHQIRAHMKWLGHAVVGDKRYGQPDKRLGLHALRLEIAHPTTGQHLSFESAPPPEFEQLLG
ncbi:MAG: RluA family pseudouridine synthase [Planctomycetes bacterium]|nr:RluA family pseudouridine synthase [Planctomycetota bacterium]